jgi:chemotaxis protein CheD
LPTAATNSRRNDNPLKYADHAIPTMLAELARLGAQKSNLIVRIAGGAQMLRTSGSNEIFNIGARNVEQVRKELARAGLRIANEDVFGHQGRTMSVFPKDGRVTVQSAGVVKEL